MLSSILMLMAAAAVTLLCIGIFKLKIRLFRWFFGYGDHEEMPFFMKLLMFHWLFGDHHHDD